MQQQIKKGKFLALLRNVAYDVFHNDTYLFTITSRSEIIIANSSFLNEVLNQFRDERDNNKG
jgi:hypothetical protein